MERVLPSASFRSHGHSTDSSSVVVSTYGGHHSDITRGACELAGEAGLGPVSPIMGVGALGDCGAIFQSRGDPFICVLRWVDHTRAEL